MIPFERELVTSCELLLGMKRRDVMGLACKWEALLTSLYSVSDHSFTSPLLCPVAKKVSNLLRSRAIAIEVLLRFFLG